MATRGPLAGTSAGPTGPHRQGRASAALRVLRRFARNRGAAAAALVVLGLGVASLAAPVVAPFDPGRTQAGAPLASPSLRHPMGTDDLGRDVLSGVLHGIRISVAVGVLAAITSGVVGTLVGAVAGYAGGTTDAVLMRLTEFVLTLPVLFLAILVVAMFGTRRAIVVLLIGGLTWPSIARLVRGQFLALREQPFVEAARAAGARAPELVFAELLPNALDVIVIATTLQIPAAILIEAGLAFLGVSDPTPRSLGLMLKDAYPLLVYAWWPALFPGVALSLLTVSLNLLGDGLNDVLNPRLRR